MNEYVQSVCRLFIFSKPMKEVMGSTNLFVFYNDYRSNKSTDEFLLVAHESWNQGSSASGINPLQSALMLTANREETAR